MRAIAFAAAVACAASVSAQDARRPMQPADQLALREVGEIRISPDAGTVVFSVSTSDLSTNQTTTRLMRIPAAGGTPAPLEGVPDGAHTVRWSPDSRRIAFFAARDGTSALWTYDLVSGQVARICEYHRSNRFISKMGNALAWSPDGGRLAFVGATGPPPPRADPLVVTRLQYKTRTSISDDAPMHILVVAANGGTPRPLTSGPFDEHSIDWGGDGSEIVFLSNREPDPDARHNYDVFAVAVATGVVRRITESPGVELEPRVSPDGRWIAYTATTRPVTTIDSVAEDAHLFVAASDGSEVRELNHALDRRSSAPEWTPDGRAIVYTAADRGKTVLYRVRLQGGPSVALIDRKALAGPFSMARDGLIAVGVSDPAMPREVFRFRPDADLQPLTALNADLVRGWSLVTPESMTFRSADGTEVEAWYYPAVGPLRPAEASVPLILSIHGGPHGMYGYGFSAAFQINAGRGYATLAVNPRGSSGYGQAFADGTRLNWGGGDYQDLMAGVDHLLKTRVEVDAQRLGVTGGSYGGYMTNWVVTQTPRFKAAVSSASVSNLISFYATSLYQDLIHAEFDGFPWDGDNYALLWKWSPLAHVGNVTTPTLFIHGEQDHDVHITQAEEMFTALRRRGVEAALARYPREGHGLREPAHILDRTERTLAWFDRFLRPDLAKPTVQRQ